MKYRNILLNGNKYSIFMSFSTMTKERTVQNNFGHTLLFINTILHGKLLLSAFK